MDLRSIINNEATHNEIPITPRKEDFPRECPTCHRLFASTSHLDEGERLLQLERSGKSVHELEESLEDAKRGEAEARREAETLREQLAASKKEMTYLDTKNKKTSRLVEELEDQLASNFDSHQIANSQLEEANAAHAHVQTELEAIKEDYATLQASISTQHA
jgi:chromosome segregation ATPase